MLVIRTQRLSHLLAFALMALMPLVVYGLVGSGAFWPEFWGPVAVPIGLCFEAGLLLFLLVLQHQVRSFVPMFVVVGALMLVRFVASFLCMPLLMVAVGGAVEMSQSQALGATWVGSPFSMMLQMAVLIIALPTVLASYAPGFLGASTLNQMTEWDRDLGASARDAFAQNAEVRPVAESAPRMTDGGATQAAPFLYSYEDLERYMEKVIGLEGYLILTDEGLPVWSRAPWQVELEDLAGDLNRWLLASRPLIAPVLGVPQAAMVHSGDRWIVTQRLPGMAMLHLFLTRNHTGEQVVEIATRVTQTVASLFAHRYGE